MVFWAKKALIDGFFVTVGSSSGSTSSNSILIPFSSIKFSAVFQLSLTIDGNPKTSLRYLLIIRFALVFLYLPKLNLVLYCLPLVCKPSFDILSTNVPLFVCFENCGKFQTGLWVTIKTKEKKEVGIEPRTPGLKSKVVTNLILLFFAY